MMRRLIACAVSLACLFSLLSPHTERALAGEPVVTQSLALQLQSEPPTLDSARVTERDTFAILGQVMEGLVRPGADGSIEKGSGAAEDWRISADGRTYTFTLKPGLKWSDGKPLTAADFAYAWLRALDPKVAAEYNYQLWPIAGAEAFASVDMYARGSDEWYEKRKQQVGIRALDDRTLEVRLQEPTPYFLTLTAFPTFYPQRQDVVENAGKRYGSDPEMMVYNGPFVLTSWKHKEKLELAHNVRYWDAKNVKLQQIVWRIIPDVARSLQLYQQNQLDGVVVTPQQAAQLAGLPNLLMQPDPTMWYLAANVGGGAAHSPVRNVHIRRALSLAMDRKGYVAAQGAGALPARGLVPDGMHISGRAYRTEVGDLLQISADPVAAQAEWKQGMAELGLAELPSLTFLTGNSEVAKRYAVALQTNLQASLPGLRITPVFVEFKVRYDRMRQGDYDLALAGWGADYDDPATFLELFMTLGAYNDPRWSHSRYDQLLRAARAEQDPDLRLAGFKEAERLLMQELPIIPIYQPARYVLRKPWVDGVIDLSGTMGAAVDLKYACRLDQVTLTMQRGSTVASLNNRPQQLPLPPHMSDGTLMVPLRPFVGTLGATVAWHEGSISVVAGVHQLDLTVGATSAKLDGQPVRLSAAPQVIGGVAMVPVRVIAEALGASVDWEAGTVTITSPSPVRPVID